jgi:hypothetical protein
VCWRLDPYCASTATFDAPTLVPKTALDQPDNCCGTTLSDGGVVIDFQLMKAVHVDAERRRLRVHAGARLGDVDRANLNIRSGACLMHQQRDGSRWPDTRWRFRLAYAVASASRAIDGVRNMPSSIKCCTLAPNAVAELLCLIGVQRHELGTR